MQFMQYMLFIDSILRIYKYKIYKHKFIKVSFLGHFVATLSFVSLVSVGSCSCVVLPGLFVLIDLLNRFDVGFCSGKVDKIFVVYDSFFGKLIVFYGGFRAVEFSCEQGFY